MEQPKLPDYRDNPNYLVAFYRSVRDGLRALLERKERE